MNFISIKKPTQSISICLLYTGAWLFMMACGSVPKDIAVNGESFNADLVVSDNFSDGMDQWHVEQMSNGQVNVIDEKLEINDASGCTIWLKEKLSGSIVIEYDVELIKNGGEFDRVSDLNCFWMAIDPTSPNDLFVNSDNRGGKFSNYDNLRLYYMGVGGNDNKTTRFRRYTGTGDRPLLPGHDLSASEYMLSPNTPYHIRIVAHNGVIQYFRNGIQFLDFVDESPYIAGHFGFRTVRNHMTIDNFKVYQLKN